MGDGGRVRNLESRLPVGGRWQDPSLAFLGSGSGQSSDPCCALSSALSFIRCHRSSNRCAYQEADWKGLPQRLRNPTSLSLELFMLCSMNYAKA